MCRKTQILLFSIVYLNLVLPTKQVEGGEVQGDDECVLQSTTVLKGLKSCSIANSVDANWNEKLLTDVMSGLLQLQSAEIKSQLDLLTRKLLKVEQMAATLEKVERQIAETKIKVDQLKITLENHQLLEVQQNTTDSTNETEEECKELNELLTVNGTHYFNVSRKIFHYNDSLALNWTAARKHCQQNGMQLAMLKSLAELEAASKELKKRAAWHELWLDASDFNGSTGQYAWSDGTQVDTSTWHKGFPKMFGSGKKTCVFLHTSHAKLWDWSCGGTSFFLCQLPPTVSPCN